MTDEDAGGRAVVCDECGRLIALSDPRCPYCGASRLGSGVSQSIRGWLRGRSVTQLLLAMNVLVYLASLALSGPELFASGGGFFSMLGPSSRVLDFLGAVDPHSIRVEHEWWRVVTAAFLHLGLIHIAFNMTALNSLGRTLEEFYGPIRFILVYMGSAIGGSLVIVAANQAAAGASGAIFGLLGAGFAYGKRRGGTFGKAVRGQFGQWVLYNVLFTFLVPGISISAHLGGLAAGFGLGWVLVPRPRRSAAESAAPPWMAILAGFLLLSVPLSFGACVVKGLFFASPGSIPIFGDSSPSARLGNWPLDPRSLDAIGAPGWSVGAPRGWGEKKAGDSQFVWSAEYGLNLSAWVIASGVKPVDALKGLERWGMGTIDPQTIASTDEMAVGEFNPRADTPADERLYSLAAARSLGSDRCLVLFTRAHDSVNEKGWRTLFDRIVASVKKD